MVHCTKCGTKNEEDAKYCSKCGANLEVSREESFERRTEEWGEQFGRRMEEWGEQFGRRMEEWGEDFGRRVEEECFGLPHGGAIAGIVIGVIIVLVGLSWFTGFKWELFLPAAVIMFGILIVAGALYSLSRRH